MDPTLAYLLIVVGLAIMAGELLLPTSGVLFGLGLTGIIVALAGLFSNDLAHGLVASLVMALLLTALVPLGLRLWRASPLALGPPPAEATPERVKALEALRGRYGKAVSALRPAGVAEFDGRRIDALSEGPFVEAGAWVRCVAVRAGRVIVRPSDAPPDLMADFPESLTF